MQLAIQIYFTMGKHVPSKAPKHFVTVSRTNHGAKPHRRPSGYFAFLAYLLGNFAKESCNGKLRKLENVSIAKALQLEAARRRSVPIGFYTSPVASLKSLSLSAAVLERIYCLYVALRLSLIHI